ncbi:hypothetical protein C0Q70_08794 [Pomacea canaliculata]|uniref:Uncharacterized protein n=1 Tax=Pomacea canaliculata TaxID=400727 RepID=A0A2T7P814_POMCA|nr:hypothetical protein C0Q70_08794 [Pomacea canaliculata]
MQRLEDMFVNQVEAVDHVKSERQLWLAEKQSLEVSVQHLQSLCLSTAVNVQRDSTGNDKNDAGQSLESTRETHKHTVFLRSDDSDPLVPVVTQLTEKVNEVNAGLQALKDEVIAGHRELKNEVAEASTSVFVRWGSSTCPASSVLVYSGEVGGSHYTTSGAAANYLCLPLSNLTLMDISVSNDAQLYGGEYETADEHHDKDPVCAVCRSSRANNVMIPATLSVRVAGPRSTAGG